MCRVPEDVMHRIISYLHKPLPRIGRWDVTWEELNQKNLTAMMRVSRMTYSIVVPMLYKEVVVNNLASFFLGVDDLVKPHHQQCIAHPTSQQRLCHLVRKNDGTTYNCPRHSAQIGSSKPPVIELYHKQELLARVEAIHFVYASRDKFHYGNADLLQLFDLDDDEEIVARLHGLCNIRHWTNVPDCIKTEVGPGNPLYNLKRLTVGRWLGERYWKDAVHIPWINPWTDCREWEILERYEDQLTPIIPHLFARFTCREVFAGPLRLYPLVHTASEINTLHNPHLSTIGSYLENSLNIIRISPFLMHTACAIFADSVASIAQELIKAVDRMAPKHNPLNEPRRMFVRFALHAHPGDRLTSHLDALRQHFNLALDSTDRGVVMEGKWDICWEADEGGCPSCQPENSHPAYRTKDRCRAKTRAKYEEKQKAAATNDQQGPRPKLDLPPFISLLSHY